LVQFISFKRTLSLIVHCPIYNTRLHSVVLG